MYKTYHCENCHKAFCLRCNPIRAGETPPPGIPEGSFGGERFCSKGCADAWCEAHPGQSPYTAGERAAFGCMLAPIKIPLWILKQVFKIFWWVGKLTFKILKSKWTWTIFSCGMAWVAWKMLDAIYSPKE